MGSREQIPGQPRDVAEEDVVDGRLDAETFGRFIKNVGGNRSAMKTEASALATRDAAALLNVFKQSKFKLCDCWTGCLC